MLEELGRIRRIPGTSAELADDPRWAVDSPSSEALFRASLDLSWTRDPFDRLLVAHAALRGFRLATADTRILEQLPARAVFEI